MNDPIVDEVGKVREAHAAKFNYDLDAIFRDIKEQERKSGRTFVKLESENPTPPPTVHSNGAAISPSSNPPIPVAPAIER